MAKTIKTKKKPDTEDIRDFLKRKAREAATDVPVFRKTAKVYK